MNQQQHEELRLEPDEFDRLTYQRKKSKGKQRRFGLAEKWKGLEKYTPEQLAEFNKYDEMTEEEKQKKNDEHLKHYGL